MPPPPERQLSLNAKSQRKSSKKPANKAIAISRFRNVVVGVVVVLVVVVLVVAAHTINNYTSADNTTHILDTFEGEGAC